MKKVKMAKRPISVPSRLIHFVVVMMIELMVGLVLAALV